MYALDGPVSAQADLHSARRSRVSLVNQKHLNVGETKCDQTRLNRNHTAMTNAAQGHRAGHGMQGCFWCPRQASRFEGLRVAPGAWHTGDRCLTISPKQCLGNCNRAICAMWG